MGRNMLRPYKKSEERFLDCVPAKTAGPPLGMTSGSKRPATTKEKSGGGFGAENALEARAGELDADEALTVPLRVGDVDDTALGEEIGFVVSGGGAADAARGVVRKGNADLD